MGSNLAWWKIGDPNLSMLQLQKLPSLGNSNGRVIYLWSFLLLGLTSLLIFSAESVRTETEKEGKESNEKGDIARKSRISGEK